MNPVKVSHCPCAGTSPRDGNSFYAGGNGVGVLGPYLPYFPSMYERICARDFPSALKRITSRVMSRQMFQVAA
jgi:hypothetical protein